MPFKVFFKTPPEPEGSNGMKSKLVLRIIQPFLFKKIIQSKYIRCCRRQHKVLHWKLFLTFKLLQCHCPTGIKVVFFCITD